MENMSFRLAFRPEAVDFMDNPPSKKIRAQVNEKIMTLVNNPYPSGCKKLRGIIDGEDAVWRIRSGDYRILYVVREGEIIILDIGDRKDIYG
jgi:mRNA interferase RelE/StbE